MSVMQQYKCPCCGGGIEFNSTVQKLKCPYCDTEFEMDTLSSYDSEVQSDRPDDLTWGDSASSEWTADEASGLLSYICRSCGGEIIGDANMGASTCPYCDNPIVLKGQFDGALKPDYVIPFKIDKKAAKAGLIQHYAGKRFLPKVFKDENHIDEIKGIYVPFWLFNANADADIRYRATRIRTWSDSDYDYTETSFFSVTRGGTLGFDHVPVDGSSKMADELMESVEPFDFRDAVDFKTAYLAGYMADRYDVTAEDSIARANERIRQSTIDAFARTVTGYTTVDAENTSIRLRNSSARYALYPVWVLNTTWNGEKYTFAMNGQTGKMVGDLPLDKSAFRRWLIGLTGAIGAVAFALSFLGWLL